jgi:hypothetical protein
MIALWHVGGTGWDEALLLIVAVGVGAAIVMLGGKKKGDQDEAADAEQPAASDGPAGSDTKAPPRPPRGV